MKIYEIGTGYTPIPAQMGAATEIVVEGLTRAFQKQNLPVEIIDIKARGRAETDLPIQEVPVPSCFSGTDVKLGLMHKLKRVVYSVCLAAKLRKLLKHADEEILLHFHNQYNLFFFLKLVSPKLRSKARIAYTNHSGIWRLDWNEIEDTIRKRYFQEAECMRRADIVFLLNEETKQNVMAHVGVPESRIFLIGNGVDTDTYRPLKQEERELVKEKYGLQNRRVILQVGSVNENKGQLRSVQYLLPLLKAHPELIYAYAGGIVDEAYQQRVLQFSKESHIEGQVRYLGMIEPGKTLNQLFNAAELTIFPSQYEAFGMVVIESFAAGVPVLVDGQGNIRLGEGSVLFDSADLASTPERILFDDGFDVDELRQAARNNAVRNYSWDKIAADYAESFINGMK